jgi:hypothetical protein
MSSLEDLRSAASGAGKKRQSAGGKAQGCTSAMSRAAASVLQGASI